MELNKVTVDGTLLEFEVVRHALCVTNMGIAGYLEARVAGKKVEIAGRWDDPYASDPDAGKIAGWWERVILDGEDVTQDEESGTDIQFGEDSCSAEDIMWSLARTLGLNFPVAPSEQPVANQ